MMDYCLIAIAFLRWLEEVEFKRVGEVGDGSFGADACRRAVTEKMDAPSRVSRLPI